MAAETRKESAMRKDYRVRVVVEFYLPLAAESGKEAMRKAQDITYHVFSTDFQRAESVVADARSATAETN